MDSRRKLFTAFCIFLFSSSAVADDTAIGRFSQQGLEGWQEKSFVEHTQYKFTEIDSRSVVKADTQGSASGLFFEMDIDINKTPYLNWSWRVDNTYAGLDETSKAGDDYPARIYVVVSGGIFFWKTRAINYVWSSNQVIGQSWDNAYTGNAKMLALRSGTKETGQWQHEKRNIKTDLKKMFGKDYDQINAIAIMSDSDNSGQAATAYYGDIFFSTD